MNGCKLTIDRPTWKRLAGRLGRRLKGRMDPEDALQEAYLRLQRYQQKNQVHDAEGFLIRAATNIDVDQHRAELRQRQNISFTPDDLYNSIADNYPLQDEALISQLRLQRAREGIKAMPPRTREVFLLHRLEGLRYREIAVRLGISQSAVEKHMARATMFLTSWTKEW